MDYTGGQVHPRRGFTTSSSPRAAAWAPLTTIGFLNRQAFRECAAGQIVGGRAHDRR